MPKLLDLVITNVTIKSASTRCVTYDCTIKNIGTSPVDHSSNIFLLTNYLFIPIFTIPGDVRYCGLTRSLSDRVLNPGESYTISDSTLTGSTAFSMPFLQFKIDNGNRYKELDETNNTFILRAYKTSWSNIIFTPGGIILGQLYP